jgi:hypothetical protein
MGANGINDFPEFCIKDDHAGTTILNDEFQLGPSQSPVERNKNGTDFRNSEKGFDILVAIVKKDRNPLSLSNPQVQKEMAELVGTIV